MKKKLLCLLLSCVMSAGVFCSCVKDGADTASTADSVSDTSDGTPDSSGDTTPDTSKGNGDKNPSGGNDLVEGEELTKKVEGMKNIKDIKSLTPTNGKKLKVAFIGDSITEGVGVEQSLRATQSYPAQISKLLGDNYTVGNFGKGSAYTLAANNKYNVKTDANLSYKNTQQYKDSIKFEADVVVIMMGVNDIRSMSCAEAREELKDALADLALHYCAQPTVQKVYIATSIYIPSSQAIVHYSYGRLAELQREVAEELGLDVIDVYDMLVEYFNVMMHYTVDRIHPNKTVYGEMASALYASLMGESFTATIPEVSDTGVVYVKTGGLSSGKGESPEKAVNSLAKAIGLLRNGGGTVVVCGPYSLEYEIHTPKHTGTIKITSVHDGVDYSTSANAKLGIAKCLYLNGDYIFEDLKMVSEMANSFITCNYNNVTFGDNIQSSLASGITTYPLILVGHNVSLGGPYTEDITMHGECSIVVNSGSWVYIRGGNRRTSEKYPNASSDADAVLNITINGGTFTNSTGTNMTSGTGMGGFGGTLNFTINGGDFKGAVYAVGRSGTNTTSTKGIMSGTVNMVVRGGTFASTITAVQNDGSTTVTGTVNLTITEALSSKAVGFTNITVE